MSGDYSRDSFDAVRDFAGVFLQQGRAALDADWNEMVRIFERRIRAGTVDMIGRVVVPRETLTGFEIRAADGTIGIGRGRLFLNGMLLECHGAANFSGSVDGDSLPDPVFDRARQGADGPEGVLDELISPEEGDFVAYADQPYWPAPDALPASGTHLVYLVAWHRELTPIEDPGLLEPALGGIDTATRWQTIWQVRVLEDDVGPDATCGDDLNGWTELIAPSTARLTTDTIDIEDPEDPCLVPPIDGYTGIENQLYRIQIHSVGDDQTDALFKFSRENGSVVAAVESFAEPAGGVTRVAVGSIGRDQKLRFRAGDWVEITDDRRELDQRSGQMLRVASVHEETREIEVDGVVDPELVPSGNRDTPQARRSRILRWDQRGTIRLSDGAEWINLDETSDGLIPVPPEGTGIVLESGITVAFSTAPGPGGFREMDHWRFAARTAGTQIERLRAAPPDGVQRHYCRLAIVTFPDALQDDCRVFWPPEFAAESCSCTVCVTPESHNNAELTIQQAIDRIGPEGGTVCLQGGAYALDEAVTIDGRVAITVRGQGAGTVLSYGGPGGAIRVTGSVDVQIERLSLVARSRADGPSFHGITAANTAFLALRRLAVLVLEGGEERQDHGIAIDGIAIGTRIEECLVVAPVALGSLSLSDPEHDGPNWLAVGELRVLDNILFGGRAAVRFLFDPVAALRGGSFGINIAGAVVARNLMFGTEAGMLVNWFEPPSGSTAIEGNTAFANGDAMRLGVTDLRLQDNEISGGAQTGDGVRLLASNLVPGIRINAQVVGNRIGDLAGAGLRIEGAVDALLAKRNVIRRCGQAAILTTPDASIRHAAIDNNVIEEIAASLQEGAAGAVVLTRIEAGQIAGNSIRGVGADGQLAGFYSGISVQGVGSVAIESNVISEIGPGSTGSPAIGILALGPYGGLSLRGNRIAGAVEPTEDEVAGWAGIAIVSIGVSPQDERFRIITNVPGISPAEHGFAVVAERAFVLSRAGLADLGPVRQPQITLSTNQMLHNTASALPMVMVTDRNAAGVIFSDNQCQLGPGAHTATPLVLIEAARIVAGNNVVRRLVDDHDAMHLNVGDRGQATVLGNLTFGNIRVFPGGLQPPFDALNLLAI